MKTARQWRKGTVSITTPIVLASHPVYQLLSIIDFKNSSLMTLGVIAEELKLIRCAVVKGRVRP